MLLGQYFPKMLEHVIKISHHPGNRLSNCQKQLLSYTRKIFKSHRPLRRSWVKLSSQYDRAAVLMNAAALVGCTRPAGRKASQHWGMEWEWLLEPELWRADGFWGMESWFSLKIRSWLVDHAPVKGATTGTIWAAQIVVMDCYKTTTERIQKNREHEIGGG